MTTSRITRSMAKALQTPAGVDPENQDFGKMAHGDPIRRALAFNDTTNTPGAPMSTVRRSRRVMGLEPDADALQAVPLAQPILEDENQNQQQNQEEGEDEDEAEAEDQQPTPADTEVMDPSMYSPAFEAAAAGATPGVALPVDASFEFEHEHDHHEHGGPSGPPPTPVGAPAPSPAQAVAAAAVEMLGRATPGHTVRQEEHFWGPGGEEASRGIMEGALPLSPVPQGRPEISIASLPSAPAPTPANTPLGGGASGSFHLPNFPAASPQSQPQHQGCQDSAAMGDAGGESTPVHPAFLAPPGGTPGGASQMMDSSPAPSEATMVLSPSEWAQEDFAFAVPVIPQAQAAEEAGAQGPRAFPGFPEVSPLLDTHSPMDTDMAFAFSPAPEITATKTKEALFYSPAVEPAADAAGSSGACVPAAGAGPAPAPLVIPSELHGLSLRQLKRRIRDLMEAREAQARTQQAAAAASPSDVYSMRDTPEARSGGGAANDGELLEDMDGEEEEEGNEGGYTPLSAAEEEEVAALLAGGALLLRGLPAPAGRHIRFEDAPTPN